jgi:integrase
MSILIPKGRTSYYSKFEHQGKQHFKSLDTLIRRVAEKRAKDYRAEVTAGNWVRVDALKMRSDVATIGKVIDAYVGPKSGVDYINSLLRMIRAVYPHGDPRNQSATILTRDFVRAYQRTSATRSNSVNSTVRQARAVFSKSAMEGYEKLNLPDLSGFMNASGVKVQKLRGEFVPIPRENLDRISKEVDVWRRKHKDLVPVYLLARWLGMRNIEIEAARWSWIEETDRGADMVICDRPDEDFSPKGYAGRVPIAVGVLQELHDLRAKPVEGEEQSENDFIIQAGTPTDRWKTVYRYINDRLRPFLPGRTKCLYELRKQAGSEVFTQQGLAAAQEFLRHADIGTTKRWYATLLNPVQPLGE